MKTAHCHSQPFGFILFNSADYFEALTFTRKTVWTDPKVQAESG
jgi:hypothetical protein